MERLTEAANQASGDAEGLPRIAIFLRDLRGGGAERMMVNLAGGIAARGCRVDLVLAVAEGDLGEIVPASVRVIGLDSPRTFRSIAPLARYLRHHRPQALLASQVHVNVAAVLAGRLARAGTRIVISERNTTSVDRKVAAGFGVRLAHRLVPWVYPRADAIVAVSEGVADDTATFARMPRQRIVAINNPVVTADFPTRWAAPVDHPWFAPDAPPVVLGVGRLQAQKDFPTLLAAFARVRQVRQARLVILGEGVERAALEALAATLGIAEDTDFPGFVIDALPYMRRAAMLALSSRWEGSPNVLVEAMACGTPVVATDCPHGPREILAGGDHGPLVPMGDADALAAAIIGVIDTPPSAERLQKRAADYGIDAAAKGYLKVLLPGWRQTCDSPRSDSTGKAGCDAANGEADGDGMASAMTAGRATVPLGAG